MTQIYFEFKIPRQGVRLADALRELEVSLIKQALERERDCIAAAARVLKMNRTTLCWRIEKLGIEVRERRLRGYQRR